MFKKLLTAYLVISSPLTTAALPNSGNHTYISLLGAYSKGVFDSNFTRYENSLLTENSSFNDKYNSNYTSIAIGTDHNDASLPFSHEVGFAKFRSASNFSTSDSQWGESNNYDIFYNFMPTYTLAPNITFKAILSAHLGTFHYYKSSLTSTNYDGDKSALGVGIGAGMDWQVNDNMVMGTTIARIQFKQQVISGNNNDATVIDSSALTPAYNLFGAHIKYYLS